VNQSESRGNFQVIVTQMLPKASHG
jgi:hypothetical protein